MGSSCLQASRDRDAGALVWCLPVHPHTQALIHQCTQAPAHPCTHIPLHPEHCSSSCQCSGSAVCCLPFSVHGNCHCIIKCCQDPGQELSFLKEKKKIHQNKTQKQTRERHDVKPLKSTNSSRLASHALFNTGLLQSSH